MALRVLTAALVGWAALAAVTTSGAAPAASPAQRYAETTLKAAFKGWARKNLPGTTVGKVSCTLPLSGSVAHCTIHVAAPRNRENIVFRVTNTLHPNGTATFAMLSHSCADSKTGKKIAC